ncbi:MAG: pyridoxal phosphate-dependent aminotransferase [Deltaproteobacteria bacterium]|nr:MAG: pyridoxal phosphate-dependent aminotransferase [Deltaproteobacteria bacterium]
MKLAERMAQIQPSPTLSINTKAKALRAAGVDVINFGVGEPDFDTPEHIRQAGIDAINEGFTRYTAVGGIDELKDAIVAKFESGYGLSFGRNEIVVSCGAKHSLYNLAQILFDPGDEVLIPSPYWVSYPDIVRLAGATPVIVATQETDGFKLRPEVLEEAITEKSKALILNSPSNPTGSMYSKEELEGIASVVLQRRLLVVSDDIYYKILFGDQPWVNLAMLGEDLKRHTIIVNGVSKTYAMTGWRIGYLAAPPEVAAAVTRVQSQSTSNPTSIAQKAALAALTGPQDCVEVMVAEFEKRLNHMVQRLEAISGVSVIKPSGTFYVFANFSSYFGCSYNGQSIHGSIDLATYLMDKAHLAVVPGVAFGEDSCLRFSFATSMSQIDQGLDRLSEALAHLS